MEIHVIFDTGTSEQNISGGSTTDFAPSWSPELNSQVIAFSSLRDGWCNVYTMSPRGANVFQVTHFQNGGGAITLQWSPDGNVMAIVGSTTGGENNVFVVDRTGNGLTNVSQGSGDTPNWSPDGAKLVFASHRDGNWEIYTVNAR